MNNEGVPVPLRALLVEDNEQDARLLLRELKRGGLEVSHERVDTPEAMEEALDHRCWDIVISDHSMPRFSAPMALAMVKGKKMDLPFIIVSGTVSEDLAVEAIHQGAHDFMAKGKLGRLIPAIERELRNVKMRAEQRKMQDQLMISDRMASMGTLASGVAHEINNPLSCVLANLDLAFAELSERTAQLGLGDQFSEVKEELRDARAAADRIRNIVRDLKIFSRSQEEKTGPVDIERVMESTLRMAWNEIRHRAKLVKHYAKTPPVEASESRLGQVFLNIVINAAQAIDEGRAQHNEIRITTSMHASGNVLIEISDTGPGMTPDTLARLFTPFFTTKPVGVGAGLGLSICHRIVTAFDGSIEASSEPGKGSTFRLSLRPAHSAEVEEAPRRLRDDAERRSGRVLVIDDEPMIAKAVQRTLANDHEVIAAGNGEEVLRRVRDGERFDVILCDLMMPHMTGMELHAELSKLSGDQADRMIFLTGGAFTTRARAFLDETPNQRIEKPFDTAHLRAMINERVNAQQPA